MTAKTKGVHLAEPRPGDPDTITPRPFEEAVDPDAADRHHDYDVDASHAAGVMTNPKSGTPRALELAVDPIDLELDDQAGEPAGDHTDKE